MAITKVRANQIFGYTGIPEPFLNEIIPDSYLPSTTGNFKLKGAFFTPTMTVTTMGGTVNYITFNNDNDIDVNITTGATEGYFSVTLNNGISKTFNNSLLLVLGTVFQPTESSWTVSSTTKPILSTKGEFKTVTRGSQHRANWDKAFDYTKDFRFSFRFKASPLGYMAAEASKSPILVSNAAGTTFFTFRLTSALWMYQSSNSDGAQLSYGNNTTPGVWTAKFDNHLITLEYIGGVMRYYNGDEKTLLRTYSNVVDSNLFLKVESKYVDIVDIKYIELAT